MAHQDPSLRDGQPWEAAVVQPISQQLYGVPQDWVIGSTGALECRDDGDVATIVHEPELDLFDDRPIKPCASGAASAAGHCWQPATRRATWRCSASFSTPSRPSLSLLVTHNDEARVPAHVAGAERVLDRAAANHWTVINDKHHWATVFADPPTN